ncbi:uncharacterized protein LOC143291754 isoform X5 [Babylonia areolata]|uniref:uncharacterized protein LOC143291754 isoform X5 n=1 Tax=Babylonia areolata TaxID=304850 RepID=UPI003FD28BC1
MGGLLPVVAALVVMWVVLVESSSSGLTSRSFLGLPGLHQVECSGRALAPDSDLFFMAMYRVSDGAVLGKMNLKKKECQTSRVYVSCSGLDEGGDSRESVMRMVVADLAEGQSRVFGCNVTALVGGVEMRSLSWSIRVSTPLSRSTSDRTTTTVAPTTTTTTTTTIKPQPRSESPVASGVKSNVQEFQLPISVVIIGLVLLLFFAILCAILVILQCRGKRRRRSRAANRESLLSAKNEPMGEGGYRTPRNIPSYPPGHMPPETPGGNFAMRYQKSIPDTGYVSGSSVYYSEPYGTLDEEMKERLRPNPRMCHIPYDIKGGPLDTSHPQEHSA